MITDAWLHGCGALLEAAGFKLGHVHEDYHDFQRVEVLDAEKDLQRVESVTIDVGGEGVITHFVFHDAPDHHHFYERRFDSDFSRMDGTEKPVAAILENFRFNRINAPTKPTKS
jgi:hypothetical protein